MDIKYEIEPVFKIEFFKIKCIDFKNKKKKLEKVLIIQKCLKIIFIVINNCSITTEFKDIFKDEFSLIRAKYNSKILLQRVWSVSYQVRTLSCTTQSQLNNYCGILYLDMKPDSPKTTHTALE